MWSGTGAAKCLKLSDNLTDRRFGVEINTFRCLDTNETSAAGILECSPGSCKEMDATLSQYHCVPLLPTVRIGKVLKT